MSMRGSRLYTIVTIYGWDKKRFRHTCISNICMVNHSTGYHAISFIDNLLVNNSSNTQL